jgi:hypothetical protein
MFNKSKPGPLLYWSCPPGVADLRKISGLKTNFAIRTSSTFTQNVAPNKPRSQYMSKISFIVFRSVQNVAPNEPRS